MIRFACPGCAATFTVTDDRAGKAGQCPKCQSQFHIPSDFVPDDGTVGTTPPPLPVQPPPLPPDAKAASPLPVEIKPCPSCQTRLSVETPNIGGEVSCPKCGTAFRAVRVDVASPPAGGRRQRDGSLVRLGSGSEKDDEDDRDRRRSRRDEDDDRRERRSRRYNDEDDDRRRSRRGGCPSCGSDARPLYRSEISTAGWVTFAVLLSFCAPLCWIGLLMKDEYRACGECGRRV
jgi:predicted Zn finger-like uncharacterized protein